MCCSSEIDLDFWLKAGGLALGALGVVLPFYQLLQAKKLDERDKRFRTYHKLVEELVQPPPGQVIMLDRQIAVVFELRNFKVYFEVTERILNGFKEDCIKKDPQRAYRRLYEEIDLTLEFIKRHGKS